MIDQKRLTAECGNHTEQNACVVSDPCALKVLALIATGPRWAAEIAECLGYTKWSQRPNGLIHARKLVKSGFVSERKQRGDPEGPRRVYFYITNAGRAALHSVRESSSTSDPSLHATSLNNPSVSS